MSVVAMRPVSSRGIPWFIRIFVASALILQAPVRGQDPATFDTNKDGLIQLDEVRSYIRHVLSSYLRDADKNHDGTLSKDEESKYWSNIDAQYDESLSDYEHELMKSGRTGLTYDEVVRVIGGTQTRKPFLPHTILRRSVEQVSLLESAKEYSKDDGALFSYTHDAQGGNDILQARGAILYSISKDPKSDAGSSSKPGNAYSYYGSLYVDRLSNDKSPTKDLDTLIGSIGAEYEFETQSIVDAQYFRPYVSFATDSSLDSRIGAISADYEVVQHDLAIGVSRTLFGLVDVRWRPIAHVEFGRVFDAGNKPNLVDNDTFLRVGPNVLLEFWPTAESLSRLSFSVHESYLEGLDGSPESSQLFEIIGKYAIDAAGQFQLEASYRNGDLPLTSDKTEAFTLGVNIKL